MHHKACTHDFFFHLNTGFQKQIGRQFRIEIRRHRLHGQVFGAYAPVLTRHVRVQRIPRFGNCAAQHASISGAHGVFVFQMCAQRMGRSVNLTTFGTRPGVRCSDSGHFDRSSR